MANIAASALRDLIGRALTASRTSPQTAAQVAAALVAAEADGIPSHGVSRAPVYAAQAKAGKVDGFAVPRLQRTAPAAVRIDAANGFAYPAIALALEALIGTAPETGVTAAAVHASSHAGVAGHHVEKLAEHGLVGLAFLNTPAAMAPWGGDKPLLGTNPIAFACPRAAAPPLVVDLSLSKVARGKIVIAAKRGDAIPGDWALDSSGHSTTDAAAALDGTMLPMGEARGAALALMVEILSAALTGAGFGFEATSFLDAEGGPPNAGQFFVALAPDRLAGGGFAKRVEVLLSQVLAQPNTRLPGDRRLDNRARAAQHGLDVGDELISALETLADS